MIMSLYLTNRTIKRTIRVHLKILKLEACSQLVYTLFSPVLLVVEDIVFAGYMSKAVSSFKIITNKSLDELTKEQKSDIYNYYNIKALKDTKDTVV